MDKATQAMNLKDEPTTILLVCSFLPSKTCMVSQRTVTFVYVDMMADRNAPSAELDESSIFGESPAPAGGRSGWF
jgi:hypothetical protein